MAEYGIYLSFGTLFAVVSGVAAVVWKLSRIEKEIREDVEAQVKDVRDNIDAHIDNVQRDVKNLDRESAGRAETLRHETGEMGSAIRQKIHEIEMFSRDTFVRKDSFELVIGRLEKSIEKMTDKLEDKIDKAIDRIRGAE